MLKLVNYKKWIIYSDGRVYSNIHKRFLNPVVNPNGYVYVSLDKVYRLHTLLARLFIPNPEGYTQVDHLDRNKLNNNITNLRWCSQKANCRNRRNNQRVLNQDTNKVYDSIAECAESIGTSIQNLYQCLKANCRCKGHKLIKL